MTAIITFVKDNIVIKDNANSYSHARAIIRHRTEQGFTFVSIKKYRDFVKWLT